MNLTNLQYICFEDFVISFVLNKDHTFWSLGFQRISGCVFHASFYGVFFLNLKFWFLFLQRSEEVFSALLLTLELFPIVSCVVNSAPAAQNWQSFLCFFKYSLLFFEFQFWFLFNARPPKVICGLLCWALALLRHQFFKVGDLRRRLVLVL